MPDDSSDASTAADAARLILRLFRRRGGLRLGEGAEALADGYGAFLRRGPHGPEPTPAVMRLVLELDGGDVVWDAAGRRWRYRDVR
jgi:hypothetical protein